MNNFSLFLTKFAIVLSDAPIQGDELQEKISVNLYAFLVQLAALIVMIILFFIFGYKPVKKLIQKRQDHIEEQIVNAEKQNQEASENLKNSEVQLLETRAKADEIIESAKKQTIQEQQAIIEKTNEEVVRMKLDAEKDIERKKLQAQEDVKKEIVNVALLASSELLKRETNTKDNELLVQQFIDDMDSEDGNN